MNAGYANLCRGLSITDAIMGRRGRGSSSYPVTVLSKTNSFLVQTLWWKRARGASTKFLSFSGVIIYGQPPYAFFSVHGVYMVQVCIQICADISLQKTRSHKIKRWDFVWYGHTFFTRYHSCADNGHGYRWRESLVVVLMILLRCESVMPVIEDRIVWRVNQDQKPVVLLDVQTGARWRHVWSPGMTQTSKPQTSKFWSNLKPQRS